LASSSFLQLEYCEPMSLEELSRVLCQSDQSCSLPQRAVALFGFQVAILSPSARSLESKARVLSALKILESMESETTRNADLEQRLRIAGYREVLDLVMREGGARTLRSLWTTKVLWEDASVRLDQARDVALMVQFSHRFAKFGQPTPRQKGGPTMARHFVRKTTGRSDGTLRKRWKEYRATAVLQYLMLFHHKNLRPKQLSGRNFVTRLFEQAEDIQGLRAFFAAYVDLARTLRPRGYKFDDLKLEVLASAAPLYELKPFSHKELEAIESYSD
jgi:hypothetical protein